MAGTGILSIGVQAMQASQAALQTVSQNIANANTPGYSVQSVQLQNNAGQATGSGFMGTGVSVQTVTRAHNNFLTAQAQSTASAASMDQESLTQLTALQQLFPTGAQSLGNAANQFLNSLVDVSNNPSDPSARSAALGQAQNVASQFNNAAQQLNAMQSGVVSDLGNSVNTVNQLTTQLAKINGQIAAAQGSKQQPNDLLDQRDQLVNQISKYVQVNTLTASDGTLSVFIGGSQPLVLGTTASALSVGTGTYDPAQASISINSGNRNTTLSSNALTGGSIAGLLNFQNNDLQAAKNLLGQIATSLASQINTQQSLGWTNSPLPNPGQPISSTNMPQAGSPIFSISPPIALPATTNLRNPNGSYAGSVSLSVTDPTQLQASAYKLQANPNGNGYLVTRLSDGTQFPNANFPNPVVSGSTIDGFTFTVNGAPGPTDTFLMEPVAQSAVNMKQILTSPAGIAASSPVTANVPSTNKGTATVNSIYAVNNNLNMNQQPMTVTFGGVDATVANGVDYTINAADGSSYTGVWVPGQPIGNQPNANPPINLGFELSLNGVPTNGDVVTIGATQFPGSNNGNAQAMVKLQTAPIVGRVLQSDGSFVGGASVDDAYASAMANIGSRVQGAQYLQKSSQAAQTNAQNAKSSVDGVNIDEEATKLMQFQQSYQAASKVLQTAQSMFQTVLTLAQN
ncbi:MAG: flagellar hook-associated protein FlgK [Burkholderiaceae bacterium]|nr:flagellar hook-associated protein FlgK [Burkholderiaceae bacterium]